MRLVSFNVNGLRGFSNKLDVSFEEFLKTILRADIVCIQEIKGTRATLGRFHALAEYYTISSFHERNGRHGVATLFKKTIACLGHKEILKGRILRTEHRGFTLYNCYMPYCNEEKGIDKTQVIDVYSRLFSEISNSSNVVICGDFNACYSMIDHYQYFSELKRLGQKPLCFDQPERELPPKTEEFPNNECFDRNSRSQRELPYTFLSVNMLEKYFFSIYQRRWLHEFIKKFRLVDTFRVFNKSICEYTCWNTVLKNRPENLGTRIDYIFCSPELLCEHAGAMQDVYGSDHCPIYADFDLKIEEEALPKHKNSIFDYIKKV